MGLHGYTLFLFLFLLQNITGVPDKNMIHSDYFNIWLKTDELLVVSRGFMYYILRGTRISPVFKKFLLRTFETIGNGVVTLDLRA